MSGKQQLFLFQIIIITFIHGSGQIHNLMELIRAIIHGKIIGFHAHQRNQGIQDETGHGTLYPTCRKNIPDHFIDLINQQNPDVVLFGGDLFDHPANRLPDESQKSTALLLLNSIEADKGKFAVLGNHDLESVSTSEMVEDILYRAGFEVLNNKTLRIRNGNSGSIVLCGLESSLLGNPDTTAPFETIKSDDYTIVLCHTPDTALEITSSKTDLFLAGHGHGGQIYFPLIGALYQPNGAQEYYRGTHNLDGFVLDITNGVGTTKADIRFLSDAEIVVYTLESQQ